MRKQYDVDVIRDIVKDGNRDDCSISWWANRDSLKVNGDGTFTMINCEKCDNGDFISIGFQTVHIPKEAVKRFREATIICL